MDLPSSRRRLRQAAATDAAAAAAAEEKDALRRLLASVRDAGSIVAARLAPHLRSRPLRSLIASFAAGEGGLTAWASNPRVLDLLDAAAAALAAGSLTEAALEAAFGREAEKNAGSPPPPPPPPPLPAVAAALSESLARRREGNEAYAARRWRIAAGHYSAAAAAADSARGGGANADAAAAVAAAHRNLAAALLGAGQPAAAAAACDAALAAAPGEPRALRRRARARLDTGDWQGAVADLDDADRVDPGGVELSSPVRRRARAAVARAVAAERALAAAALPGAG